MNVNAAASEWGHSEGQAPSGLDPAGSESGGGERGREGTENRERAQEEREGAAQAQRVTLMNGLEWGAHVRPRS